MIIKLSTGTLDINDNMDGWCITSKTATYVFATGHDTPQDIIDDLTINLVEGDRIDINGNVYSNNVCIANIA